MPLAPIDNLEPERRAQLERTLALARAGLGLLALALGLWQLPLFHAPALAGNIIIGYNLYALLAAVIVGIAGPFPAVGLVLHVCDTVWAVAITTGIETLASAASVFFLFVLVGAAYRWGLWQAIATSVAMATLQTALTSGALSGFTPPITEADKVESAAWSAYMVGLACLIGYLAGEQNRAHARASAAARALAAVDLAGGFRASLERVLNVLRSTFDARRVLLLLEERATGRIYRWSVTDTDPTARVDERPVSERETWFFALPATGRAWRLRRSRERVRGLSDVVTPTRRRRRLVELPAGAAFGSRVFVGVLSGGEDWTGRLLIIDPRRQTDRRAIDWLATLMTHLGAALYSLYLLRQLRSRVSAVERSRLARELHDGLIQALVGLEMQVEVVRRTAAAGRAPDAGDIARIQQQLHTEVLNARELMQQVRPLQFNPRDLPGRLADLADRFRRDTGIEVQFVCTLEEPELSPRLARELLQIAQEALVNVRKHSAASHVLIRFGASPSHWTLVIDDNGRGFEFTGRHTLDELDHTRRGPAVIKERVRGIRGGLVLDSLPGRGSSLEINVPRT